MTETKDLTTSETIELMRTALAPAIKAFYNGLRDGERGLPNEEALQLTEVFLTAIIEIAPVVFELKGKTK